MNLLGLILLAALSGGIVAVSLRLRPPSSSPGRWPDGDRLPDGELQQPGGWAEEGRSWRRNLFGLRGESQLYQSVED